MNPSTVTAGQVLNATKWNQDVVANSEFLAKPPSVSVTRSTEQNIATGVWRSVAWNTEGWDTDSMWSSTAATRIDINTAGKYLVVANVPWAPSTAGVRRIAGIYAGAPGSSTVSPNVMTSAVSVADNASGGNTNVLNAIVSVTSTQVIRIPTLHDAGASINLLHDGNWVPRCDVIWQSS